MSWKRICTASPLGIGSADVFLKSWKGAPAKQIMYLFSDFSSVRIPIHPWIRCVAATVLWHPSMIEDRATFAKSFLAKSGRKSDSCTGDSIQPHHTWPQIAMCRAPTPPHMPETVDLLIWQDSVRGQGNAWQWLIDAINLQKGAALYTWQCGSTAQIPIWAPFCPVAHPEAALCHIPARQTKAYNLCRLQVAAGIFEDTAKPTLLKVLAPQNKGLSIVRKDNKPYLTKPYLKSHNTIVERVLKSG